MSRICSIVLVCEGWRDSRFARSFLAAANIDPRKIDNRQNQGGSGHDWVKTEFVDAVADVQRFREGHGVLGLLDEDGQGVSQRRGDVARRLSERGLPSLDAADGRCLLLPTRNLETWLYWLEARRTGKAWAVNETDNYKTNRMPGVSDRETDIFCHSAGAYLHEMNHLNLPLDCPPMLADALRQLRDFLRRL
jgi:hypothetical protein